MRMPRWRRWATGPCRISAQTYLADMYPGTASVVDGPEFDGTASPTMPMLREARR